MVLYKLMNEGKKEIAKEGHFEKFRAKAPLEQTTVYSIRNTKGRNKRMLKSYTFTHNYPEALSM